MKVDRISKQNSFGQISSASCGVDFDGWDKDKVLNNLKLDWFKEMWYFSVEQNYYAQCFSKFWVFFFPENFHVQGVTLNCIQRLVSSSWAPFHYNYS